MTQAIQPAQPDLSAAAERLKEQIRSAFVDILTPEQWQGMIQAELVSFTQPRPNPSYNQHYHNAGSKTIPSVLSEVCEKVFREFAEKGVREALSQEKFRGDKWDGKVGQFIQEWLTENQERLIQSTILQLAGLAAQGLVTQMRDQS